MLPTTAFVPALSCTIESSSSSWSSETAIGDDLFDLMSMTERCPSPLPACVSYREHQTRLAEYTRGRNELALVVVVGEIGNVIKVMRVRPYRFWLAMIPHLRA